MFVPFKKILDEAIDNDAAFRARTPKSAVHRLLSEAGHLDMAVRRYAIELQELGEWVERARAGAEVGAIGGDEPHVWVDVISDPVMWQGRVREKHAAFRAALVAHELAAGFDAARKRLAKEAKAPKKTSKKKSLTVDTTSGRVVFTGTEPATKRR